jgi:hypothetical protein
MAASSAQCVFPFDATLPSPYIPDFTNFILERHTREIMAILEEADDTKHYSLNVEFVDINLKRLIEILSCL